MARRQRRLRGTGSVFQRRDGRWEGRWQAPADGSGPRPWIWIYAPSESEADAALADAIRDYKKSGSLADRKALLGDYLTTWFDRAAPDLRISTRRAYELAIRLWITPRIGSIPVSSLTGRQVQAMTQAVAREHGIRSAGMAHAVLRKALEDARRLDRIVERNVAKDAKPPRWQSHRPEPWTTDQAASFLDSMSGQRLYPLFLLSAMTGLRPAEALGLEWDRVDLDRGRARIDHAIVWPVGGKPGLGKTKSEAGRRVISLPPRVVEELRSMKKADDRGHELFPNERNLGLVFTEIGGRPMRLDTFNHRFAREVRRAGYPHIRLYDLRRLAATMMIKASSLDTAARALGHSSIRLAAETYGYEMEASSRSMAEGVEDLLSRGTPSDTSRSVRTRTTGPTARARSGAKRGRVPANS